MHPWFLCRKYRLFWMWLNAPDEKQSPAGSRFRYFLLFTIYLIFPVNLGLAYHYSGLWDIGDSDDRLVSTSLPFIFIYLSAAVLLHKSAFTTWCMPEPLANVCSAFGVMLNEYEVHRYWGYRKITERFEADLIKRTDIYFSACRKASAEEVALSALFDISLDLNLSELHDEVGVRLEEIERSRSRIDRIVAYR